MVQYPIFWIGLFGGTAIYWLLPVRLRATFLAVLSFGLISTLDWQTAVVMLVLASAAYLTLHTSWDKGAKLWAGRATIAVLLAYLALYKVVPSLGRAVGLEDLVSSLLLPLGISFFTFKLIHYAIETGRGTLKAHGPDDFMAYVFLFPIFTAGPIERFDHFINQCDTTWNTSYLTEGLTRIAHGMIKKFVFGSILFILIDELSGDGGVTFMLTHLHEVAFYEMILFLLLTCLFIYMDFSGYSDIAIGASRLFGLRIMENFNYPFLAPNIGNLWKRWHMSLANWCQAYIYMPMIGITRNPYLAVMSSFLVMGLWHAVSPNWVAWGMYNAICVMAFQTWASLVRKRKWKFVKQRPYTYLGPPLTFIIFSWSFAFTITDHNGGLYGGVRLLAKCIGITLPT